MSLAVFIGDETSAAGYRLAGLKVRVPREDDVVGSVRRACDQAQLVLLSAEVAQRLPSSELDRLLAGREPEVVVVPDLRGGSDVPDLVTRVRQQLGMLE
jgi:vacuolar-type H+-ATPase subunit F/Vma7